MGFGGWSSARRRRQFNTVRHRSRMANGGHWATDDEWRRVEAPLLEVDAEIGQFAKEFGLRVTKNLKDWPERSIAWGSAIRRLIQLYLVDEKQLTFNLWLCASQDRGDERYWKHEKLISAKTVSEFKDSLPVLLREARMKLEAWSERDLELAVHLHRP